MRAAIVFDDGQGRLGPLTDLRASFEVRTGALTTLERLAAMLEAQADCRVVGVAPRPEIAALTTERLEMPSLDAARLEALAQGEMGDDAVIVNGRCVMPPVGVEQLVPGSAIVHRGTGAVLAARLAWREVGAFLLGGAGGPVRLKTAEVDDAALLIEPWDVIRYRDEALDLDLAALMQEPTQELPAGVIAIGDENLRISEDALVYPGVVLDAANGPIVIDDEATVRPGAIIIGPAYVGVASTVLDRTLIKAHTAIGPVCKVAGEVGGVIFQGFANKGHDGHLGDAWIGEWVNLGAGTTNSNLLNTYGEVTAQAEPGASRQRTGLTFLGCVLGDHVKTAICTRVMTGSVVGTGSMLATTAALPTTVGRFEWLTDERRQSFRLEKFLEVARAMMSRRKVKASATYEARVRALHASSAGAARVS